MSVLIAVGKRSEIIKTAPIIEEFRKRGISHILVDVQQERGWFMKGSHYLNLNYSKPDYTIKTTKRINLIQELWNIIEEENPSLILGVGRSETTLSLAYSSIIYKIPFLHVESGYRCYDLEDIDEVRRQLIDNLSSICYAPSQKAFKNLVNEGFRREKVVVVGSTLLDSMMNFIQFAREHSQIIDELDLEGERYVLLTIHKDFNLNSEALRNLLKVVDEFKELFVFPVHPETKEKLREYDLYSDFLDSGNILMVEPLDYIDFIRLEELAEIIITDSGSVSEEAVCLSKPTVFLGRTDRLELIEFGAVFNSSMSREELLKKIDLALRSRGRVKGHRFRSYFGAGLASERIVNHLIKANIRFNPRISWGNKWFLPSFKVFKVKGKLSKISKIISEAKCRLVSSVMNMNYVSSKESEVSQVLVIGETDRLEELNFLLSEA